MVSEALSTNKAVQNSEYKEDVEKAMTQSYKAFLENEENSLLDDKWGTKGIA
jgi:hypothetical protein